MKFSLYCFYMNTSIEGDFQICFNLLLNTLWTKGDKDSSVVIMKKSGYVTKLDTLIDDGIVKGTYVETTDNTLKELLRFQDFLHRKSHNYER